ncbi:hypothetical protein ACEWY4_007311 [Coilia grayii]|uniref:DUF4806 domain-containing protein n=1 Tax=Coilia grayii TaxID=363190 RepID=A0ABD1KG84_9TELE
MPYAVVLFTETNEVEVIPMSWLSVDQKIAFWPPYKQAEKAKAAVQNVTEPDETWGEFFVQVFKTYDTYEAARKRLPQAMKRSSLTSEDEGGKRVRMASTKKSAPKPHPQQQLLLQPPPVFYRHTSPTEGTVLAQTPATSASSATPATPATVAHSGNQIERDQTILRALEELKVQVRQNYLLLQALTKRAQTQLTGHSLSEDFRFPMTSEEDLTRVEELLCDKAQEKALTAYLATLGGLNPGDVVRRMMRHVLVDQFAANFNWLGRGGRKKAFASYKIASVIRGSSAVHKITASECEAVMKNWLRFSGDRSGGRKRRQGGIYPLWEWLQGSRA